MAKQQGGAHVFGTSEVSTVPGVLTWINSDASAAGAAYVSPIITSFDITHHAKEDTTMNQNGDIVATLTCGEYIECSFELIPFGSTTAAAKDSAYIPPDNSVCTITGMPIIKVGTFTDALNVAGGALPQSAKWIYASGWNLHMVNESKGTARVTLRRYPKLTGGAAILIT